MLPATAPHVRSSVTTGRLLNAFVVASLPAMLIGVWNLGYQTLLAGQDLHIAGVLGWRGSVLQALGMDTAAENALACVVFGLLQLLPLFATATAVAYGWERIIAKQRRRAVDPAWFMTAWLFVLLLPPATPVLLAALGMSFAAIIGTHIFGGTGRYLVSPALLGALFLHFSYPGFVGVALPLPDVELATTWVRVAAEGPGAVDFVAVLLGVELGAAGTVSTAACILGAAYLVRVGAASPRTLLGAIIGLVVAAMLANLAGPADSVWQVSWYWHLALGNFAFALVFLATDPTTSPLTPGGRCVHGALLGGLTIMLRVVDPAHPEGTLFAVLLAGLAVPFIDHVTLRLAMARALIRLRAS